MILNSSIICILMVIAFLGKRTVAEELDKLTLEIQFPSRVVTIKFSRINRVLANEHLPVWITTNKTGKEFEKLNIMKQVGKISFFHDLCSKSSLVYYHKRKEIDGVLGTTYYIKRFQIDEQAKVQRIDHSILLITDHYTKKFSAKYAESVADKLTRSQRSPQQKYYPEMLVVINHEAFRAIEENSDLPRGVATVSHILTVNNAADLIYQLLMTPKIQLNIAGIVIEGILNQWAFESDVIMNSETELEGSSRVYVNSDSIHTKVSNYFWLWQNIFPRHSYDMIQYLTTSSMNDRKGSLILGQSSTLILGTYMFPPNFIKDRVTIVVKIFESYKHFTTIAHELAHTFTVQHDGYNKYGYLFDVDSCRNTIMSKKSICSTECLKWSLQAYAEFANYFRTEPARCNLLNYPRSLDVPKPKFIHSVAEQCECYGHEPPFEPFASMFKHKCDRLVICKKKNFPKHVKTTLPMDGTPCGNEKVCWNDYCVEI